MHYFVFLFFFPLQIVVNLLSSLVHVVWWPLDVLYYNVTSHVSVLQVG